MATEKLNRSKPKAPGASRRPSRKSNSQAGDYRKWLEHLQEGIWVIDRRGLVTYANPRMAEILGYKCGEITGRHVFDFMDEKDRQSALELEKQYKDGIRQQHAFQLTDKNGCRVYASIESSPIFDENGKYHGVLEAVQDITWRREIEDRLKQSDERFKALFDNPLECVFINDLQGRYIEVNSTLTKLLGYSREELLNSSLHDLLVGEDKQKSRAILNKIKRTGQIRHHRGDWTLRKKDGGLLTLEVSGSMLSHDGKPFAILGIARDVTRAKQLQESLLASEERYRLVVENSSQGILVAQDEMIKWVNNRLLEISGYSADELLKRKFADFIHPDDRAMVLDRYRRRLGGEDLPSTYSFRIANKSGDSRWVELNVVFIQWEGRPATLNFLSDITEHVKAEEALQDSYREYRDIIEFLPDATFVIDTDGNVIAWNMAIEEMTGVAKKDILGKGKYAYSLPFYGNAQKILIDHILENDAELAERYLNVKREGHVIIAEGFAPGLRGGQGAYYWAKASRLINSKGELTGAIETVRDITEFKLVEKSLLDSEKKYRDIFENALDGMYQSTPDGRLISANNSLAHMLGHENAEQLLDSVYDISTQIYTDPAKRSEMIKELKHQGKVNSFETEFIDKDGRKFWVSLTARAINDETGNLLYYEGAVKDISLRRRADEELNRVRLMQEATLESTIDGIIVIDNDGNILLFNQRMLDMWSMPRELLSNGHMKNTLSYIYELVEDPDKYVANYMRLKDTTEPESLTVKFKDGRILERFSMPFVVDSRVAGRVINFRDVTDLRRMEEELTRKQKLDSLGILAGGIAHDFNNILTGILGNITLARMEVKPDTGIFSILEEAEKAAIRAKDLTLQLLTFARGGAPIKKTASISELLHDTARFALRGSKSRCDFQIQGDLWHADIDRGQISQVINNMVINSDEAMPQGGTITIKAENAAIKESEITSLLPGRYIKIVIADNGLGIPEEHISRIFDPYFTTKQKGSGLGLATSYSIVKNHGGIITVSSRLGVGSTFTIYIPASQEPVEKEVPAEKQHPSRQGRILIMDDEYMVLEVATRMLRHIGFSEIQTASDGNEAIEIYQKAREEGNPFTIVILDLTVPGGMGGEEAIKALAEIDPSVKVIVSSGYSSGPVLSEYKNHGFSAVVSKPYTIDELSRALDEALNL